MNIIQLQMFIGQFAYTFGSRTGVALNTPVTSRTVSRRSTDLDTDVITVSGGTYQLRTAGVWSYAKSVCSINGAVLRATHKRLKKEIV